MFGHRGTQCSTCLSPLSMPVQPCFLIVFIFKIKPWRQVFELLEETIDIVGGWRRLWASHRLSNGFHYFSSRLVDLNSSQSTSEMSTRGLDALWSRGIMLCVLMKPTLEPRDRLTCNHALCKRRQPFFASKTPKDLRTNPKNKTPNLSSPWIVSAVEVKKGFLLMK